MLKQLGLNEDTIIKKLTAWFGGYPRLYTKSVEIILEIGILKQLEEEAKNGQISLDSAKNIYSRLESWYGQKYFTVWINALRKPSDQIKVNNLRISTPTLKRGLEYVKRINTIAVAGLSVETSLNVWDDDDHSVKKSFQELSETGLFTLTINEQKSSETISLPLLTIHAFSKNNEAVGESVSPLEYGWDKMEIVAMNALRCQWNARYYIHGNREFPITVLRPGAYKNPNWNVPKVLINKEIGPVVLLAEKCEGDIEKTEFKTGSDGKGRRTTIQDGTIYLMAPNQEGNDGLACFFPCIIFNQTKSRDLVNKKGNISTTKVTQNEVAKLVGKQQIAAKKLDLGKKVDHVVFDLFTNRNKGLQLNVENLPSNVLLTTEENFAEVVGPIFKATQSLFV